MANKFMSDSILITGVAGFIGSNVARKYLEKGIRVIGIDNLSRNETEINLKWLGTNYKNFDFYFKDVRDKEFLGNLIKRESISSVIHLAGQVAVTSSVENPIEDKEINIDGTLNVLEAVRNGNKDIPFLYSSTNKVYGGMEEYEFLKKPKRYEFKDRTLNKYGISEKQSLDFHSPYGCSKGSAGSYVKDYSRIYGMKTVVFHQSCIYGDRQFGHEDQGWVIHFVRKALRKETINVYGDGKQVRDLLYVSDLVNAYEKAIEKIDEIKGNEFNIGGGPNNTVSLLELLSMLEDKLNQKIKTKYYDWRPGDQKVYCSDIRKAENYLDWIPEVNVDKGLDLLIDWAKDLN